MSDLRILDEPWNFESASNFEATSASPSFPVSNLTHILRSKVWRSAGNFVIDSSNNKIDFKDDSSGSEITSTLIDGSYSVHGLAEHISARMTLDSTNGSSITASYSTSSGKWTIASGGASFELLFSSGTNAANTIATAIGFDSSSDNTGAVTYTGPSIAIHTIERVTLDLGNTQAVDSVAVLFEPLTGFKFTDSATIRLKANAHPSWSSASVNILLSYDSVYNVITHFFSSNQSYRYWCLEIVDAQNPNLYVEIPKFLIAKATQLTEGPNSQFTMNVNDLSERSSTKYGQFYTDVYPNRRSIIFPYQVLGEADLATLLSIYDRVGIGRPIALALDSAEEVFDKDRFFIYGVFEPIIETQHVVFSYFNSGITLTESF